MNRVFLYGSLGDAFGRCFQLELDSPRCAIRALSTQLPGFCDHILQGNWRVVRGKKSSGMQLSEKDLAIGMAQEDLHILPTVSGAGDGVGKVIVGAAMIGAAFLVPGLGTAAVAMMAGAGAGIMLAGVTMMVSPMPEADDYEAREKDSQSFLFNGPVNVNKQGVAVPLIYGEVVTGSVVISAGIKAEDIEVDN